MKRLLKLLFIFIITISLCGCQSNAKRFKEEYESRNGLKTSSGKEYRTIEIDEHNPFVYTTLEELNKKIENNETFIVYFGAWWCPWCRSTLPTFIKKAKEYNINKVYYVNVRETTNEEDDIRDIYKRDPKGRIELYHEGTEAYHKFLEIAGNVLKDYNSHDIVVENTKRVGAPNFIMFKDGKAVKMTTGKSDLQSDGYMELTEDIIKDFERNYDEFLSDY